MRRFVFILGISLLLFGCGKEEAAPEKVSGQKPAFELEEVSFEKLGGFDQDQGTDFIKAWKKSCAAVEKTSGDYLGQAEIKISREDYLRLCNRLNEVTPRNLISFIKANFTPFLVKYNGSSEGKFTSYYEAVIHASRQPSSKYKYPIYGRPDNLIEFNPHDFDSSLPSKRLVGRVDGTRLVPYYERREIMQPGFEAPVILWGDSYVDIYIMQIQGSAVARLDDGSEERIAYADNNGREFQGIGSILLRKGLIKPGQASMGKIKQWLNDNYAEAVHHMNENQRFIFHRFNSADGPIGAQGVALTAGRSLAVDRNFVPLGALLWLETSGPDKEPIHKLMVAQDIGGAIKGAVRGDYFWGSGDDDILHKAGRMNAVGRYFVLIPKTEKK